MTERSGVQQWETTAALLRTVSHPVRLRILEILCSGAKCVADVNDLVDVVQPNLSQHLAVLRDANLVASHINGPRRCYYLLRPSLARMLLDVLQHDHPVVPRPREEVLEEVRLSRTQD